MKNTESNQEVYMAKIKGVYYNKFHKKYRAQVFIMRKQHHLGYFKTEREAEKAIEVFKKTVEYKRLVRIQLMTTSTFKLTNFLKEDDEYENEPLSAGKGGIHYGNVSAMSRMTESVTKEKRQKKVHIPYKPMPQMHTLYSLEDMRRY
jgi:hypothetical protein